MLTLLVLAFVFFVGTAVSCSARQNVRYECDNYGKTELPTTGGDAWYSCSKLPPSQGRCITFVGPERRCTQWSDQ